MSLLRNARDYLKKVGICNKLGIYISYLNTGDFEDEGKAIKIEGKIEGLLRKAGDFNEKTGIRKIGMAAWKERYRSAVEKADEELELRDSLGGVCGTAPNDA